MIRADTKVPRLVPVILVAAVGLAQSGAAGSPQTAPASPAPAAARPAAGVVVDSAWLAAHLDVPSVAILDARPSLRDYLAGHIPGAQPLGVENLRSAEGGVPGQLFPAGMVARIAGRLGLTRKSRVVVYGAENDPDATFVASALRLSGFAEVAVLDGGLEKWVADGGAVTPQRRLVTTTDPPADAAEDALAGLAAVTKAARDGGAVIVDARPPDQYEAGRIAGAVSRFWKKDLVAEGEPGAGLFRSAADLEAEYAALGVTRGTPVIVYCNTGHMASEVFFTLRYRLGYGNVRLYDGSWTEWTLHPDLPTEKGPAAAPR